MDFVLVNTLVGCNKLVFGAVPALQGVRPPLWPTGFSVYASPALFTLLTVSLPFGRSAAGATLDTGGWLALTRRGLAPRKIRQASLGTSRRRDAGYPAPPAQIPACGTPAPGSSMRLASVVSENTVMPTRCSASGDRAQSSAGADEATPPTGKTASHSSDVGGYAA